jgi:catechol 2,3-dioxygenase-like lactoylglutathione lyase family enzyme
MKPTAAILATVPVLPSLSLDESETFYQRLGFSTIARYEDDYLIVARDGCELHFFLHGELDPARSFANCYWRVRDAEALFAEWQPLGLEKLHEPEVKPWGVLEFAVVDAHGNLLRIGEELQ